MHSMSNLVKCFIPNVTVYLEQEKLIDPFQKNGFRGEESFYGKKTGWERWVKPSPEPYPDIVLNNLLIKSLSRRSSLISGLHEELTLKITEQIDPEKLLLVGILRAGLYVSIGLLRRLECRGYNVPVVALALFHEAGIDQIALRSVMHDYPGKIPVFVDGWTGRGVVAMELKQSVPEAILATLIDPGHYGDLRATDIDSLVESAHFTATETLGFSRAYITDPAKMWKAYKYPDSLYNEQLLSAWNHVFNSEPAVIHEIGKPQNLNELLIFLTNLSKSEPADWKVNINEVVRSLVNRYPQELIIGTTVQDAEYTIPTVLYSARKREIPTKYIPEMRHEFNCLAAVRLR